MLGAIIGDIVGSRFEFANTHRTDFELFADGCNYTDDTICTIAVADALLGRGDFAASLQAWCRRYPHPKGAYGGRFHQWIYTNPPVPYRSFGNGSAMRVSPCGWLPTREEVLSQARASAACTHNHPEGIKGAEATAEAIYMLRNGMTKKEVAGHIEANYHYDLSLDVDDIRAHNHFDETCQVTVPQAFACFLAGSTFEEVIRLAISIGGDSDTIGAIAGSLAEAYYGVPQAIEEKAWRFLPSEMQAVITAFRSRYAITKDELIKQCRYYKGEEENPFDGVDQDKTSFWYYEEMWVNRFKGDYIDEQMTQSRYLAFPSVANANRGKLSAVPVSLQLLLFNRYMHWLGGYRSLEDDVASFVAWLKRVYLGE